MSMKRIIILVSILLLGLGLCQAQGQGVAQGQASGENQARELRIAVFGGSLSVFPESRVAKAVWEERLGARVTDFGVGGAGFSKLQGKSLQGQVDRAVSEAVPGSGTGAAGVPSASGPFDIYILWASTNDFTHSRPCGDPQDYTIYDGFDESKLDTQCGGINYCIKAIRDHAPEAVIVFFTSLPFFSRPAGYESLPGVKNKSDGMTQDATDLNATGKSFEEYIQAQLVTCALQDIPVLHQFGLGLFTPDNYRVFYRPDRLHLKESGYALIGPIQADFLLRHLGTAVGKKCYLCSRNAGKRPATYNNLT